LNKISIFLICLLFSISCDKRYKELHGLKSDNYSAIFNNDIVFFTPDGWLNADPTRRGKMIASLFRYFNFLGMDTKTVFGLLGKSTGSGNVNIPNYIIIINGRLLNLEFVSNRAGGAGRIVSVQLVGSKTKQIKKPRKLK